MPSKMPSTNEVRDIPPHLVKNYLKVNLYIDGMHVNGIIFLMGVSRHIGLIQYVCIRKNDCEKFLEATLLMIRMYQSRGVFEVINIGTDKAFDSIKSILKDKPYQVALTTCNGDQQHAMTIDMSKKLKE